MTTEPKTPAIEPTCAKCGKPENAWEHGDCDGVCWPASAHHAYTPPESVPTETPTCDACDSPDGSESGTPHTCDPCPCSPDGTMRRGHAGPCADPAADPAVVPVPMEPLSEQELERYREIAAQFPMAQASTVTTGDEPRTLTVPRVVATIDALEQTIAYLQRQIDGSTHDELSDRIIALQSTLREREETAAANLETWAAECKAVGEQNVRLRARIKELEER